MPQYDAPVYALVGRFLEVDMGLNVSQDAFSGAYSAFDRLRKSVASAMGGSWPPHEDKTLDQNSWYWGDDFSKETHPGLLEFMSHSDCEGNIAPDMCIVVADDLESLLPKLEGMGGESGHLAHVGGYAGAIRKFIKGCRAAAAENEPLDFY